MTSRNLFSKLAKHDLKQRTWAIALLSLGMFFAYPVAAAMMAGDIKDWSVYEQGLNNYIEDMMEWVSFINPLTVFIVLLASLICGLSSFSYLNSRSQVDFYHGLPVRREKLFLANYVSGILIMAVPYAIFLGLALVVGIANGVPGGPLIREALRSYGLSMTMYFLSYSLTVTAAMLTGHLVVGFLGTMVLNFYFPLLAAFINGYCVIFYHTFVSSVPRRWYEWGVRISPVTQYFRMLDQYYEGAPLALSVCGILAAGLALGLISCLLYKRRPSEAAGKAMAFNVSRPIICMLMTVLSSLGLGCFFWEIMETFPWALFGVICGGVVCHCVIQIIYHFDFRRLLACKLQLAACLVFSVAVMLVFRFDLTGYDRYLPGEGQLKDTAISFDNANWASCGQTVQLEDGAYEWKADSIRNYSMEQMHVTDYEIVSAIVSEGIRVVQDGRDSADFNLPRASAEWTSAEEEEPETADQWLDSVFEEEQTKSWTMVLVRFTLNNGRQVYRRYSVDLMGPVRPWYAKLVENPEYQKGVYPLMNRMADTVAAVRVRNRFEKESCLSDLTAEEKEELLATYQKELSALTLEKMEQEMPVGLIRFTTEMDEKGISWRNYISSLPASELNSNKYNIYRYDDMTTRDFYPIYPDFTGTLALLRGHGIEAGDYLRDLPVNAVRVTLNRARPAQFGGSKDEYGSSLTVSISDPEEVAQLRKLVGYKGLFYYNPAYRSEQALDGWLEISTEAGERPELEENETAVAEEYTDSNVTASGYEYQRLEVAFPKGKVPAFVKKALKEAMNQKEDS